MNIDACRVAGNESTRRVGHAEMGYHGGNLAPTYATGTDSGRWPSNVVLSHAATPDGEDLCGDGCVPGCPVPELDAQSGQSVSQGGSCGGGGGRGVYNAIGARPHVVPGYRDTGGASRYFPVFRYQAKAPARERPKVDGVAHSTVKPLALMRWLVRLVTQPGGVVLDPFAGSGTTAQACVAEGFRCITIEREAQYLPLITARLGVTPPEVAPS
jgi:site-specific DNA-methyltransferase (adenine-specific)